jgi:endonuclease/exonuclease/phosphatase (EEP) superfamily protein YafD
VVAALLLVPAVVLTLARLSGSQADLVVRAVSFTPAGVPLYAAALLLVLGLAVGAARRRVPLAAAVVLAVGLGLHLAWVVPWYVGDPAAASDSGSMRVMTANLLGDSGDGVQLVEAATEADVDVLVVEEMSTATLEDMRAAGLDALLPHEAGEPAPQGVAGTMVFAREPITDVTRLPTEMGSWSVRVGEVSLFAVHPAYPLAIEEWRSEQAALRAAVEEERPDLVVGDFNATLDHRPMRDLLAVGYRDATEASGSGWQPTWPEHRHGLVGLLPPLVQIDHVLVADGWTSAATWTLDIAGSDHRALVAEVAPPAG